MERKIIAKVTIVKNSYEEYVCKAYDQFGKRIPDCDYFTPDKKDAENTRIAMLNAQYHQPLDTE